MKKLITVAQVLVITTVVSNLVWGADYIIRYNEKMVGAGHPTLADTLNRGFLINHNADGTHQDNSIAPGKLQPLDNITIGGTTPAAGSFSSLTRGDVSDTEFSYLGDVTGAIQAQFTGKAPLASPTFTGTVAVQGSLSGDGTGNISGFDNVTITGNLAGDGTGNITGIDNITATTRIRAPNIGAAAGTDNGTFSNLIVKESPWVDVRAHGAVAGGSASANATALAAAFAYGQANNIPVLIPTGVFAYNGSGLVYTTSATVGHAGITGEGPGSVLDYQGDNVALTISDDTGQGSRGPLLSNFRITTSAGSPVGGLHLGGGTQYGIVNVGRVEIDGFDGTNAYGMKLSKVVSSHINDSILQSNYYGLTTNTDASSYPTSATFTNTRFRLSTKHGAYVRSGLGITFKENCVFESNQASGIVAEGNASSSPPLAVLRIVGNHFENNGLDNAATDYNIDVTGYDVNNPVSNVWIQSNYMQDTIGGGHVRYGKVWNFYFKYNYASGSDGAVDVANTGSNRRVEWVGNHTLDETNVTTHGNNAEDADQYQARGINLRTAGSTFWSTHQLKAGSATASVPGDNTTLTTMASLILNGATGEITGGIVLVSGYKSDLTAYFVDLVALSYGGASIISSKDTVGSPAARTYSVDSNINLQVKLANDGGSYFITASQLTN